VGEFFWLFMIALLVAGILVGEDFILTVLYLLLGSFVLGRLWGQQALRGIKVQRKYTPRAFLGETVPVRLEIKNEGWLPLAWLHVRESLPVEIYSSGPFQRVVNLGPKGAVNLEYFMNCRKRGYYPVGPLDLASGDVLGISQIQTRRHGPEYIAVFPKIIPLRQVKLPSHSPLGTLRSHQPIFEDPSRVRGKRDYIAGDSLRRVDWKASASKGSLQVKLLEPSIALETAIFVNLNAAEYDIHSRFAVPELAIVVAASLANWVTGVRQAAGLITNGADPFQEGKLPLPIPPRRGRGHLMRILELLARVQVAETTPFVDMLRRETSLLPWGTTLIVITNKIDDNLFDALFTAQRSGLSIFLIQCGRMSNFEEMRKKASYFGMLVHQIIEEEDMDIWRH
jgi:uncharacterized protein (DUF58 family)